MMKKLYLYTLLGAVIFSGPVMAQDKVQWITFQEAIQRAPLEKKKIMVDVHTKWCGWCKVMDQKTFSNPEVARYINSNYLAVKFDAEEEGAITFKGKQYNLVKQGKRSYHELAAEIMRGRLSYPTIVFLDAGMNVIQPIPGYQDAEQYLMVLRYFGENHYQRTPWDRYSQQYKENLAQPARQEGK
jgi:thioredoxin-related protein